MESKRPSILSTPSVMPGNGSPSVAAVKCYANDNIQISFGSRQPVRSTEPLVLTAKNGKKVIIGDSGALVLTGKNGKTFVIDDDKYVASTPSQSKKKKEDPDRYVPVSVR
jgi:hypothetical protein